MQVYTQTHIQIESIHMETMEVKKGRLINHIQFMRIHISHLV